MISKSMTNLMTLIHISKVLKKMMLSYYKMIKIHLTTKKLLRICTTVSFIQRINSRFKLVKRYPAGIFLNSVYNDQRESDCMQISTNPVVILFRKWLRLTQEFHELTRRILWYLSFPNQKPGTRCYWCRLRHDKLLHRNSYRVWNLSPLAGIMAGDSVWTSS